MTRQVMLYGKGMPQAELMTLFRPGDRAHPEFPSAMEGDTEPYTMCHAYLVPVPRLIERLEILGFTIPALKRDLERSLKAEILDLDRQIRQNTEDNEGELPKYLQSLPRRRRLLQQFTLRRWVSGLRALRTMGILDRYHIPEGYNGFNAMQKYILNTAKEDWDWPELGLPVSDIRFLMRALLACAAPAENVILDLSELDVAGYFEADEQPTADALAEAVRLGRICEKILVLTEGRTDTRILTKSLNVLYPHVADMYSFLDHEAFRLAGGTSSLASLVKGLAGVGIGNRVIAVFDNDTAGELQAGEVRKLNLPDNFRIMTLPPLAFARRYPTLGPNGAVRTNINGCACSIELYLGPAALTQADGSFVPVQWTGFEAKLKRYQGEIVDKNSVQERFLNALDNPAALDEAHLASIRSVLHMIFTAFADE